MQKSWNVKYPKIGTQSITLSSNCRAFLISNHIHLASCLSPSLKYKPCPRETQVAVSTHTLEVKNVSPWRRRSYGKRVLDKLELNTCLWALFKTRARVCAQNRRDRQLIGPLNRQPRGVNVSKAFRLSAIPPSPKGGPINLEKDFSWSNLSSIQPEFRETRPLDQHSSSRVFKWHPDFVGSRMFGRLKSR